MSVRILWDPEEDIAVLYDSTSGYPVGAIFDGGESYEQADRFLSFLTSKKLDARAVQPNTLRALRREFEEAA